MLCQFAEERLLHQRKRMSDLPDHQRDEQVLHRRYIIFQNYAITRLPLLYCYKRNFFNVIIA